MQMSLLEAILHWNIRPNAQICCFYHAHLEEARKVIKEMSRFHCQPVDGIFSWQCPKCGILDHVPEVGPPECPICDGMPAAASLSICNPEATFRGSSPTPAGQAGQARHMGQPSHAIRL